ncbi:MAG: hypothetical protein ABEJ94_06370 [Halorientalis sp.]
MPTVEVSLPQDVHAQFERLVDEEFVTQEEAVEELLSAGLEAYTRDVSGDDRGATDVADEYADDMWDTAEDPAAEEPTDEGPEDDYF